MLIPSTWLSTRDNLCLLSTLTLMLDILLSPIGFNRHQIIYCKPLRSRHFAMLAAVFADLYTLGHWHAQLIIACPLLQRYRALFCPGFT